MNKIGPKNTSSPAGLPEQPDVRLAAPAAEVLARLGGGGRLRHDHAEAAEPPHQEERDLRAQAAPAHQELVQGALVNNQKNV